MIAKKLMNSTNLAVAGRTRQHDGPEREPDTTSAPGIFYNETPMTETDTNEAEQIIRPGRSRDQRWLAKKG